MAGAAMDDKKGTYEHKLRYGLRRERKT